MPLNSPDIARVQLHTRSISAQSYGYADRFWDGEAVLIHYKSANFHWRDDDPWRGGRLTAVQNCCGGGRARWGGCLRLRIERCGGRRSRSALYDPAFSGQCAL